MSEYDFIWIMVAVVALLALVGLAFIFFFNRTQQKIISGELARKVRELEFQRELAQKTVRVQEEERSRIARNLHDAVSSKINLASLYLHQFSQGAVADTGLILHGIEQLRDASETARKISHELMPAMIEKLGWTYALEDLVADVNCIPGMQCDLVIHADELPSYDEDSVHLFRILQELVNNTLKHAHASRISIVVSKNEDDSLEIHYNDNGIGLKNPNQEPGLGLGNIKTRIDLMEGKITFNTPNKTGFNALIALPTPKAHAV